MTLNEADKNFVVETLADQSLGVVQGSSYYFKNLILRAELPKPVVANRIGALIGSPEIDARTLVAWSESYGVNPNNRVPALGSFLLSMMDQAGMDQQLRLPAILVTARLLPDDQLDRLQARFQIPIVPTRPAALVPVQTGPEFTWRDEREPLELQGLFDRGPLVLDVGLILQAAKRALGVCRVEVGNALKGTGILIEKDLVLTNYHVVGGDLTASRAELDMNAPATVLRFGAFTSGASPDEGQTVKLAPAAAIVDADPQLDFALLRTSDDIAAVKDLRPFSDLGLTPARLDPLYILQHPQGGPMKLALSDNGVSWVDPTVGVVQYLTRADFGSSGSPCFDSNWKLVALHHAGNTRKGEGILIRSIFDRIRPHLLQ
ncbi:trypsin-like serine peptidase [Bradyrhizobium guangxiense]|uniref:trypsin-like serine peptidase n=1 Tax=Bradyrhizobium guangxiense TaxID=1325115 RepID=UPI001008D766|nr:serine protease [Bradyrhizobium guangxiense]